MLQSIQRASRLYTKALEATDLIYSMERSTDLVGWSTAPSENEILSDNDVVQVIKLRCADRRRSQIIFAAARLPLRD
jgi:hypothetical protein